MQPKHKKQVAIGLFFIFLLLIPCFEYWTVLEAQTKAKQYCQQQGYSTYKKIEKPLFLTQLKKVQCITHFEKNQIDVNLT